jgi:signal transduction histidine kinase
MFINYFGDVLLKEDLKKGIIYFYTQRLGDSLNKVYNQIPLNTAELSRFYKQELKAKNIDAPFKLNPANTGSDNTFLTQKVNTALRRPYIRQMMYAGFESPDAYFLKEMKWLLITSLLLIGITVFCFGYTVKTLLSQQQLAELKNDFVNNMTHELKTPVATINIAAEAIQDFNLSKTSADEYLGIIRYQANSLSLLIDQLLKSVVMEQSTIGLNLTEVNMNVLIVQLIHQYKPQFEKANASMEYTTTGSAFKVMIDESLLKNAIANLLDNALKYGGQNVTVCINCYIETGNLTIRIADNGPGIAAQYHDKIFDRFFRIPTGDIHNIKGYGLGLSFAKSIVELHSGSLKLVSHAKKGTEFIISIPLIYHETSQGAIA